MRLVDVMTLQWAHVDFDRKEIRKVLVKTLKGRKQRHVIPMTELVERLLRKWRRMGRTTKFVFGLLPDTFDYITSTLREKMTDLGFDFLPEWVE